MRTKILSATLETFQFNKNYDDNEQVRPYYAEYAAVRAELDAAGQFPYNSSFEGRIPGIIGPDEGTAIYLLQTMHGRDDVVRRVAELQEAGGYDAWTLQDGETRRGLVVHYGFYMGGTGWDEFSDARLTRRRDRLLVVPPRKRNGFYLFDGGVMIREGSTK